MKFTTIFFTLLFAQVSFGQNCKTDQSYVGWEISYPQNFSEVYEDFKNELDLGIESGRVIADLDGVTVTDQTSKPGRIYMRAQTWDNLETSTDEMYGDFAILSNKQAPEEILEIRGYKNGRRLIFINTEHLACVSVGAPWAENAIY